MGFISLADVEAEKEAGTTKGADPTEKSGFTPIEETGFTPVKGRTWGEFGKDVALSAVQGVDMLAKLPAMAYDKATTGNWYGPETQKISAMSDEREKLKSEESQVKSRQKAQIAKSAGEAARAHVGEGALGTAAQVATEFGVSFWEAAKDPASIPEFVAQQAAQLGVMGKVGRGAEVAAQGVAKAAPRAAATRAGQVAIGNAGTAAAVGTGATLQGVDVGSDTMQRLMALPDALWQENPEYVALAREIGPQAAKERVASRLATDATLKAGAVSVATAALPGGSAIERALVGKGTGLKAVPRAFAGEAGQEGAEEGSGAYFGNKTVQQIDASQDAFEGVGTAAGQGAFMGGVMGGGISAGAAMAKRAASPKEAEIEAALNAQTMGADPATGMIPAAKSGVASPSGDGGLQGAHQGADERLPRSAAVDSAPEVRLAELEILAQSRELSPVEKREAQSLVEQIAQSELEAEASPVAQTPSGSAGRTIASDRNYLSPQVDGNVMPAAAESSMESADLPGTGFIPIAQTQADTSGRGGFQIQALETNDPAATELMLPTRGQDLQRQALQNRDRSRAASVAQMADIARNPDYLRLATSRSPETGAPMVFAVGDARVGVPAENIGKTDVAVMSDGQRVPFQYAVVDASTVEPSNFADGRSNPAFAADVIGTLKALSNGRTAGLRAAYEEGTAQAYQAELMADVEAHGVPVEAIQRTPNPILVRVYSERLNTPDMATKSQGQALGMSPVELAIQDARLITTHALASLQPGDVASAANRDFVRTFIGQLQQSGLDVAGLMTADGTLSPSGRQRLQAAVMQAAYGDVELVTELFDSLDNDIKSIGEALKVMAGEWANLRDSARQGAINPAVDITGNLVQAVNLVRRARRDRVSLFDLTRQPDLMTGQTPDVITVGALRFFYGGSYFARALGRDAMISMLRDYVRSAMTTGADADMFGEQVSPDLILASFENQGVSDAKNSAEERGRTPDGRPVAGRRADEARPGKQRHGGDEGVSGVGRTGGQGPAQSGSDSAPNTRTATSLDLQALDALRREALQIARTGAFAKQGLTFKEAGDRLAVMFKGQEIARLDGARSRENIVKAIKAAIAEAAPDAAELVGERINREWVAFSEDAGTLGIPRADMPQIQAEHRGALVQFLKARGIEHEAETAVDPATLKPTQTEFSPAKVEKAKESDGGDRAILVSADGHVLDGHHQWMARREQGQPVRAIRFEAPMAELLPLAREFPSAGVSPGAGIANTTRSTVDRAKLEKDFSVYPTRILNNLIERGAVGQLYKAAGVRGSNAFDGLPMAEKAAAYVKFVEQGGKPVDGLPEDYNAWVTSQEREAEVRRLQSDRVIRQANGKPFKSKTGAQQIQERFDLQGTHEVVAVEGGFVLRQLSPTAQAELKRKAEGRESYTEAQAAAAAEMGIGTNDDGEWDVTDAQFDELERRTEARLRGETGQVGTGRVDSQPAEADRFPSVATVTGLSVGPAGSITPRAIAPGRPLYRETNLGGLDDLMRTDAQAEVAAFFVADNADLALGQGDNKGVQVVFRPDALSGRENRKPATGDIAGREYQTDMMAPRAVQTITMKAGDVPRLRGLTRRALADFEKEVIGGGLVRYHRKGLPRVEAAPVLTSPTPDAVVAQQERAAQADALDAREQAKRESEVGAGQFELAREDGRQDTTGDIFAQPQPQPQPQPTATDAAEKKPARARKAADRAPAAEPVNQDVGEQLYANRRNFTGRGVRWDDVRDLNDTLKLKEVTKAKVWPRPDYEKLVADGMPQVVARLVKQVYDGISAGPTMAGGKAPSDADLQRYIDTLGKVREGLFAFVNDGQRVAAFARGVLATVKRDAAAIGPVSVIDLARDAMDPQGVASVLLRQVWPEQFAAGAPTMSRFARGSDAQKEASIIGGNKALGAMQFVRDDLRKWVADLENGWPAKREAWQVQGYRVLGPGEYTAIGREQPDGSTRRLIGRPDKRGSWQANLSAEQLAESPFLLVQDGGFGAQAFKTREAAIDAAREKVKRQAGVGQDIRGTNIEDAERTGPARRQGGEDITSQRLMDTFGFRGVNFGREGWINQAERQAYLNQAFDGLMDLADVLGVPPRAMSLDGKLGIAFGAQGKGRFAAHFVPGYNEINLTRTKGAGTLAHEWGHALDHHFALQAGLEKDAEPFLSGHAYKGDKSDRMVFEDGRYVAKKGVPTFGDGIRPEIVRAFRDIYQAMNKRNETPEEAETRRQSNQATAARRLEQWTRAARRQIEDSTSTNKAELLGQFDQHAEKMRQGDLGDGYEKSGNKAFSSRVAAVRSLIKDATGRLWSADETSGLEAAASFVRSLAGGREAGIAHEPQKVGTQYKRDSAAMDAEKGGKAYWSTPAEMFARAFELYVHDKLAQRGASNTFLTDAQQRAEKPAQVPDNSSAMARASGAKRDLYLYPVGQERDMLRGAFDDLVQAIETREAEDGNITLLSRRDSQTETPEFKRWFGDSVRTPARSASTFDEAREAARAFQGKDLINAKSGLVARVSRNSLDKMLSGKAVGKSESPASHSAAVANLDALFESATLGWSKPDSGSDTNIQAIHRFFAPLNVQGRVLLAKLTIKEMADGVTPNRIYSVESVEFNEKSPAAQWVAASADSDGIDLTSTRSARDVQSLAQSIEDFNRLPPDIRMSAPTDGETDRLDFPKLQALAQRLKARMPNMPKVHVLADPSSAPKALREYIIRQDAWYDVEGAMHDGELYLFASGLADEARAEHVLLEHEAAHYGLRAILGPSLKTAMRLVYIQNASVRRAVADLQKRGKLSDLVATEEVIVDIPTAELARLKGWRKVVDHVRAWLAERGYTALAERIGAWLQGTLSQQQRADLFVAELVGAARDYVAGKVPARAAVGMGTRLSGTLAEDIERQEKWLQREAQARGFKDIEDLLARDYPLFEKLAELWRKKNPADVLLSRSPDTQAAYEARIDALFAGGAANRVGVKVLDRSDMLDMLGFGGKPVVLQESKVLAGRSKHPNMKASDWKKVPQWLENPAAVFDSDTEPGRLVFIAPEMVDGAPVRLIVEPEARSQGQTLKVSLLVNAYDAQGKAPFSGWIARGLLRYADKKEFPAIFAQSVGLQLPDTALRNKPGTRAILTEKNLAGYRRAQGADGARLSRAAPGKGPGKGNAWTQAKAKVVELTSPAAIDRLLYEFQDKLIDLRRMRDHIKEIGGAITDLNDAYLGEELYHKRLAKRSADFLDKELKPLLGEMRARAVSLPELEQYLHARHAPEANRVLAERNPNRAILDAKRKKAADAVRDLAGC